MARAIFGEVEISFSWQAQHVLKLREIAGARNVNVSIHTKCATKMGRVTSPNQRAILSSDYPGSVVESPI